MPTFSKPSADADEAVAALRGLAHATRTIRDPADVYCVLGALSTGLASLEQALHQVAAFHDQPARRRAFLDGDQRAGRAAAYQVSSQVHRAAEIVHQAAAGLRRAHQVEATIAYDAGAVPSSENTRTLGDDGGLSW